MVHEGRCALDFQRHDIGCYIATNVDGIAAHTTNNRRRNLRRCGKNVEGIVALQTINFGQFKALKTDVQTRTVDALIRQQEAVVFFCAQDDNLIDTCATINLQRRVNVVKNAVITGATKELGIARARCFGVVRFKNERSHNKQIVAVFAKEFGQRLV